MRVTDWQAPLLSLLQDMCKAACWAACPRKMLDSNRLALNWKNVGKPGWQGHSNQALRNVLLCPCLSAGHLAGKALSLKVSLLATGITRLHMCATKFTKQAAGFYAKWRKMRILYILCVHTHLPQDQMRWVPIEKMITFYLLKKKVAVSGCGVWKQSYHFTVTPHNIIL